MCFSFTKTEGKPTDQSRRNSADRAGDGEGRQRQGRVTDAEGEQSVLAQALRRPKPAAGKGKRAMAIRSPARVGGQIRYSGEYDGDEPEARREATWGIRPGPGKKKNKRGEAIGSAAPWRGCPLGLVHLNLREFCFCRKLEEARVGEVGHFRKDQQIVASEAVPALPLIAVFVETGKGDIVPRLFVGSIAPNRSLDATDPDFINGFLVSYNVFLLKS